MENVNSNSADAVEPTHTRTYSRFKWFVISVGLAASLGIGLLSGWMLWGTNKSALEKNANKSIVISPTVAPTISLTTTISPIPTLVGEVKPTNAQERISYTPISSWQTYTDAQGKFSLQYPANYKQGTVTPGSRAEFLSCTNDICLSGFSISVESGYDGRSRRVWLEKKVPNFLVTPHYEEFLVAGSNALLVMDGNEGGSTGSFVLLPKNDTMYLLSFPDGWKPSTKEKPLLPFIKQVLSSFRFL